MSITIKEIARITGTSTTAVSFVLNGKDSGLVSPPKRERILAAIRKHGYRQNNLARGLQAKRTYHIGICVRGFFEDYPIIGNFSVHDAISRLMRRFSEAGYGAEWLQIDAAASPRDTVATLANAAVDGVVLVKWDPRDIAAIAPGLRRKGVRAVCFNTLLTDKPSGGRCHRHRHRSDGGVKGISWCDYSFVQAAEAGTQWLIDAGCKTIGLLDFRGLREHRPHREGYLRAMRRHDRRPVIHVAAPRHRINRIVAITRQFLAAHPAVDGMLVPDNFCAMFVAELIRGKNIRMVAIGDTCFAHMQRPKIVHLSLPVLAMADWCAATLIERIESRQPLPAVHRMFECDLVVR
ncbi:MAG: LacI family DNA-binding transcriptional regulator [Planctomycetota bacterium]